MNAVSWGGRRFSLPPESERVLMGESSRVRSFSLVILATLAVIAALYVAREFFIPVALAFLLNMLLRPVARKLETFHLPAPVASGVVVLSLVGILVGAGYLVATPVRSWLEEAPADFRAAKAKLAKARHSIDKVSQAAQELSAGETGPSPAPAPAVPPFVTNLFGTTAALVAGTAEVLLLLYLLMASGDMFLQKLVEILPLLRDKRAAVEITREVQAAVGRYLGTSALIFMGQGLLVGFAMWALQMPTPWLWGGLTMLLEFIPYGGAAFMSGLLAVVAFGRFHGLGHIAAVPLTYLLIATIQNSLVSPIVYGNRLRLNPVAVLVGVLFWWFLWGVAGALLAVPFFATIKIMSDHVPSLAPIGAFLSDRGEGA